MDTSLDDSLVIRKRDILDKLNSLFKENKFKTGISSFDAQVVTEANLKQRTFNIFSNANIQNLVLDSFKIDQRMKVGINEINIDFVPQLKGKSHFGIYITDDWIFDAQKIEKLFELAEKFRNLPELKVYLR